MTEHLSEDQLHAYLDGELDPIEQAALNSHLQNCLGCQAQADQLRQLFHLIESVPEQPLERDLTSGVLEALQPRASWLPSLALGELIAAAAIAAALVIGLGRTTFELNLGAAIARLATALDQAWSMASLATSEALTSLLAGSIELELPSAGMAWAVAAAALALWALGNGLVLRRVRRED